MFNTVAVTVGGYHLVHLFLFFSALTQARETNVCKGQRRGMSESRENIRNGTQINCSIAPP